MRERNSSFLSNRLLHIFRKRGGDGESLKPFIKFPSEIQDRLSAQENLQNSEVPIIACFFDDDNWTLLTTERLLWCEKSEKYSVPWSKITDATVDPMHLYIAGGKRYLDRLVVVTDTGSRHELHLEAGQPFVGFWNVLKTIAKN